MGWIVVGYTLCRGGYILCLKDVQKGGVDGMVLEATQNCLVKVEVG